MGTEQHDSVDKIVADAIEAYPFIDPKVEAGVDRINKLKRYFEHLWEKTAQGYDLNSGGYKVLLCLIMADGRTQTPGVLAKHCLISTGAMTNRIDRLEDKGYVERIRDTEDRRSIKVRITDEGVKVLENALVEQAKAEIDAMSALTEAELDQLNTLLGKLMVSFETRGDLPQELLED
jgi:DNA-binding MarR family transcriptional regulator